MDILWETLAFVVKVVVVVVAVATGVALVASRSRDEEPVPGRLVVRRLNDLFRLRKAELSVALLPPGAQKKALGKARKEEKENAERSQARNVFVLDFKGDLLASAVEDLREIITAVIAVAAPDDEVVVRLESGGGAVPHYGLAASQLQRLRAHRIRLVVCIDRIAASGGYMMACVADSIVAAPFAIIGSIGVAAPVPNVHRLLQRVGVDYEDATAGEYKRTVTLLGEITPQGRKKFQAQLDETHDLFKGFVQRNRPSLDIERVATGEHWLGERALELELVNELMTSDDYLMRAYDEANVFALEYRRPKSLRERVTATVQATWLGALAGVPASWRS
ncbi:MAG: protease SohB [Myxococcota bacterium]